MTSVFISTIYVRTYPLFPLPQVNTKTFRHSKPTTEDAVEKMRVNYGITVKYKLSFYMY